MRITRMNEILLTIRNYGERETRMGERMKNQHLNTRTHVAAAHKESWNVIRYDHWKFRPFE